MDLSRLRGLFGDLISHMPEIEAEIQAGRRGHLLVPPDIRSRLVKRGDFVLDAELADLTPSESDKAELKIVCPHDSTWAFFVTSATAEESGLLLTGYLLGHWDHRARGYPAGEDGAPLVEIDRCVWLDDDPDEDPAFVPYDYRPEIIAKDGFAGLDPELPHAYERSLDFKPQPVKDAIAEHERLSADEPTSVDERALRLARKWQDRS